MPLFDFVAHLRRAGLYFCCFDLFITTSVATAFAGINNLMYFTKYDGVRQPASIGTYAKQELCINGFPKAY